MSALAILFLLALGTVVQQALPLWPRLGQSPFPVLLALTLYYALHRPLPIALATALAAGLLQDAPGLMPLGFSSVGFAFMALLANRYRDEVFVLEGATQAVFGALAAAMVTLWLYLVLRSRPDLPVATLPLFRKLAGGLLLGAIVTPPVHRVARWMDDRLGLVEHRILS